VTFTMQWPNQVMPGTFRMIGRGLMGMASRTTSQVAVLSQRAGLLKFQQCRAAPIRWRTSFVEGEPLAEPGLGRGFSPAIEIGLGNEGHAVGGDDRGPVKIHTKPYVSLRSTSRANLSNSRATDVACHVAPRGVSTPL
jgi:hypothetical protein